MKQILLNSWYIIIVLVVFFIIANVTISLNPFKITFEKPLTAIGWFLIIIGISFIIGETRVHSEHKGYMRGVQELSSDIQESIKDGTIFK